MAGYESREGLVLIKRENFQREKIVIKENMGKMGY